MFCQVKCHFFIPKIMQCINFDEHFRKNEKLFFYVCNKFVEYFYRNEKGVFTCMIGLNIFIIK